jgi:uncharacterized protein YdiU (UPF0061 family)
MFHLGVPTTRALSLILTGDPVERDMFYDGHPKEEPGAAVCRLAPSFTRFGSFEIFASRGDIAVLKQLMDYTIQTDFPHLGDPTSAAYIRWFEEVSRRTADLIVQWMRVGFVHGVMNTDNMSILGLTLDYGPYGWLDNYDPNWTPNTTDATGRRYRFGRQPQIAHWNLVQLGNAIYPLIQDVSPLQQAVDLYVTRYQQEWKVMMARKLGLSAFEPQTDETLIGTLITILPLIETDMTIFYRRLADLNLSVGSLADISDDALMAPLMDAYYVPSQITRDYRAIIGKWLRGYIARLQKDNVPPETRRLQMNAVNPIYTLHWMKLRFGYSRYVYPIPVERDVMIGLKSAI